jgi:hypothetical protein
MLYFNFALIRCSCGVQILFRKPMPSDGLKKLTNEEIKWLIIRVGSSFFTVKKAACAGLWGVTERRVQQWIKMHREPGGDSPVESKEKTTETIRTQSSGLTGRDSWFCSKTK